MLGILNIIIALLVGKDVYASWIDLRHARSLREASVVINMLYDLNKNLSQERAASFSVIYAPRETAAFLFEEISQSRGQADMAIQEALSRVKKNRTAKAAGRVDTRYRNIQDLRKKLDVSLTQPPESRDIKIVDDLYNAITDLIVESQKFILVYSRSWQGNDAAIGREMMFKYFVWELAEFAGRQYAMIGRIITESRHPSPAQQEQLMSMDGRIQYGWDILHKYALRDEVAYQLLPFTDEAQTQYFLTFDQIKGLFYGAQSAEGESASYPISIEMWLGMAAQAVDSLVVLQTEALKAVQRRIDLIEINSGRKMLLSAVIFLSAMALSLYCWGVIVFRVTRPVNAMVNALYKATKEEIYEMPKISHRHDEISKLARVLEVFQENARKMKQSNEELERFAYIAAHDLKSPLRAVDNISQWLEEDLAGSLQEKDKKYMEELRHRVRLMDKMLDDTLEYARIGSMMRTQESEIINGKVMVENIVAMLALPKEFTIKIGDNLSRINLESVPLQQVLYNLVNNALKHHDKDNGVIEVDVETSKVGYVFSVRDDGPGIAPQYHQKIFEMFQTLQPRDKGKGRGMGLAIVRKIITSNGGKITVDSMPGEGSVFRFTWPKSEPGITGENTNDVRRRYA